MPQFRYRALDSNGKEVEGVLDARDANYAVQQLSTQGFRLRSIEENVRVVHKPKPTPVRPAPKTRPSPIARQKAEMPESMTGNVHLNKISSTNPNVRVITRKTKPSTNSELYFIFAQLSNLLRGGITPTDALTQMVSRSRNKKYVEPFRDMAKITAEGTALSTALEHYPDLFPPGVVGAVRAGEEGGYMPEALNVVSEQCHETHKIQRIYWWLGLAVIYVVVAMTVSLAGGEGVRRAISSINDPNDPANTMGAGLRDALLGPIGLGFLLFLVMYIGIKIFLRMTGSRRKRHEIALRTPLIGKRASCESLSLFSWHLNKLGEAGLSPFASWNFAARAVPNIAYSEKLLKEGRNMGEQTKFSQLFYNSDLFPHEVAAMVETGEMSGNVGPSLEQAMDHSRNEQKVADNLMKAKAGCWGMLLFMGGGMIAFLILYISYLKGAVDILGE